MKFQKPKGTKDILPSEIYKWHFAEQKIREVMDVYNFKEIRTPAFEHTEIFTRGVGEGTDIVGKEMYTFTDKGGESMTLRPEGTAPVMRAYLENSLGSESPLHKLYYITNMFRYEKPQAGRFREHTQFGAEIIGSDDYKTDVELISLAIEIYNQIGITDFSLKINSMGKKGERGAYLEKLIEFLKSNENSLSMDSKRRLVINPLRILDSKDENDRKITSEAPKILDNLSDESRKRFDYVLNGLTSIGIDYEIDFRLVRGLDYYTDTTFEFISSSLGAQDAIGGGGRYDGLIETLGGKPTPGVGFGSGIERILMVAEKNNFEFPKPNHVDVYIIALNDEAKQKAISIMKELREKKFKCDMDFSSRSFKAQMREANKIEASFVMIIGEDEMKKNCVTLKNMWDSSQEEIPFTEILTSLTPKIISSRTRFK